MDVKIINGVFGDFRVGSLKTDVGCFAIKDKLLDQYEEGSYEGLFNISKIAISNYSPGSRLVVEMRATLESIALETAKNSEPASFCALEQDPLEEEIFTEAEQSAKPDVQPTEEKLSQSKVSDADEILFGSLWPLETVFKLDPTVGRVIFRKQRDRLKELEYKFKPIGQYWTKL